MFASLSTPHPPPPTLNEPTTQRLQEAERRLKDLVSGKKPAGLGNGLAAKGGARSMPGAKGPPGRTGLAFPAKLSCDDDTRLLQLVPGVTYLELAEHVRQLYPSVGPFVLKYLDK
jgi:hypothetical protein